MTSLNSHHELCLVGGYCRFDGVELGDLNLCMEIEVLGEIRK
jgi:hypothetical protein